MGFKATNLYILFELDHRHRDMHILYIYFVTLGRLQELNSNNYYIFLASYLIISLYMYEETTVTTHNQSFITQELEIQSSIFCLIKEAF